MQTTVIWKGELTFEARSRAGHPMVIDSDGEAGPSPMEYVLNALGGCSSIDVVMILHKARQEVTGCRCELSAERAQSSPRVFTAIHARFIVSGRDLGEAQVARAVQLSFDRYCSVARMLEGSVRLSHSWTIEGGCPGE